MKQFDLHNHKKIATGFKTPNNYFEQFEAKMMDTIAKKDTKTISLFHKKRIWISGIAAILVAVIAVPAYFNLAKKTPIETALLESYLSAEYSTYELANSLTNEEITNLENALIPNKDAVEAYLLDTQNLDYYINE